MRLAVTTLAFGLVVGAAVGAAGVSLARAAPFDDTFTLERHDTILAEAQGCSSECRVAGQRRICTVRSPGCNVVCRTLPECRPEGRPIQVCAVFRGEPR